MDAVETLRTHLIGTWSLQSYTTTSSTDPSDIITPMGSTPQGMITYTSDGFVSVHIQKPGQPLYASPDFDGGTEAELAESGRNYAGYCGPFRIEEEKGGRLVLWHSMELNFNPNWKGQTQKRLVNLKTGGDNGEEDTLTLRSDGGIPMGGGKRHAILVWKRKAQKNLQGNY